VDVVNPKPQFGIELLRPSDRVAVVALEGEVDVYSSRQLKEALTRSISEGATHIIIDLVKVTFIDSTALGVLVGGLRSVGARDGTLDIVCCDQHVRYVFEVTKLDRIMHIYGSRHEALAAS
jgi:anti-sigma B factor antagonist